MLPYILIIIAATLAAAGIVVTAPNYNAPPASSSSAASSSSSQQSINKVEKGGSCSDFNTLLSEAGVEHDEDGETVSEPGLHGTTQVTLEDLSGMAFIAAEKDFKGAGRHYKCSCNGQTYDVQSTCLNECKVSLKCFAGICKQIGEGKECTTITYKLPPGDLHSIKIFAAQWNPPANASSACKDMAASWNKKVTDHENEHAAFTNDLMKKFRDKADKGFTYTACADTLQGAKDETRKDLENEIQNLKDELDDKDHTDEYDKAESLDCSVCP